MKFALMPFGKASLLIPTMGKWVNKLGSLASLKHSILKKDWIQTSCKIDLVGHPLMTEGLGKYIHKTTGETIKFFL